jgi:enediyne polyketide synthase
LRVRAWVDAPAQPPCVGPFQAPELLLGDPPAADAALHVLLVCVPPRLALPASAQRCTVWRRPEGMRLVEAAERWHGPAIYRFDIDVTTPDGAR